MTPFVKNVPKCGLTPGPVAATTGFDLVPAAGPDALAPADTVVIPGTRYPPARIDGVLAPEAADALALIDENVLFVDDGDVLTSAELAAGIDLCLHIIRSDHGAQVANAVARYCVVPPWEWASQHLDEELTVQRLARPANMSARTFNRRFREETGQSPGVWVRNRRVDRARELLESRDLPVDEVARLAGLGSAATCATTCVAASGCRRRAIARCTKAFDGRRRSYVQRITWIGTFDQPATFAIATRRSPAVSTWKSGIKSSITSSAIRPSIRARAAPRQLWTPYPKLRLCPDGFRSISNRSEPAKARSSRVADPLISITMLPAGMVVPCSVTSRVLYRSWYCEGASYRSSSSNAQGILLLSSRSFCHWSGFAAKVTAALPMSFTTVSAPAPPSIIANAAISRSVSFATPSPRMTSTWVSLLIMSSCGWALRSQTSS
jgi:AraC-like DNA-binding protein